MPRSTVRTRIRTRVLVILSLLALLALPAAPVSARADEAATASIAGQVRSYQGQPLADIYVTAWRYQDFADEPEFAGLAVTATSGNYLITDLPAGSYTLVFTEDSEDPTYGDQLWPGNDTGEDQEIITLGKGERLTGIDARMYLLMAVSHELRIDGVEPGKAPVNGTLLTADWEPDPTLNPSRDYQWLCNGKWITMATGSTYRVTRSDIDCHLSVQLILNKAGYQRITLVSAKTAAVGLAAPQDVKVVRREEDDRVVLYASPVGWGEAAEYSYAWLREGVAIRGAATSSYEATPADVGRELSLRLTVRRDGQKPQSVTASAGWICYDDATVPGVRVTGTHAAGHTLTGHLPAFSKGATVTTQWWVNFTKPKGATGPTFTQTKAHVGKKVYYRATVSLPRCAPKTTAANSAPVPKTTLAATPKTSGTAKVGSTLKVKRGTWTSKVTFSYRWYANGKPIAKATKSTLKIGKSLKGKRITVAVKGKRSGYATVTRTSKATRKVR